MLEKAACNSHYPPSLNPYIELLRSTPYGNGLGGWVINLTDNYGGRGINDLTTIYYYHMVLRVRYIWSEADREGGNIYRTG